MEKVIQQIPLEPGLNLYIVDFNTEKNEVMFRFSDKPKELLKEEILGVNQGVVITKTLQFPLNYLRHWVILE